MQLGKGHLQDLHDLTEEQVEPLDLLLVLAGNLRHVGGGQVHSGHVELPRQQVHVHGGVELVLTNIPS